MALALPSAGACRTGPSSGRPADRRPRRRGRAVGTPARTIRMPPVSRSGSRAADGYQSRIIQRARTRQARARECRGGTGSRGPGCLGAGRCGRPDRLSSYSGITLSDEGGLKRTRTDPPLGTASETSASVNLGIQNEQICVRNEPARRRMGVALAGLRSGGSRCDPTWLKSVRTRSRSGCGRGRRRGRRVLGLAGGESVGAGTDLDGPVAADGAGESLDGPACLFFDPAADGPGGEHDGQVGFDRGRPRAAIGDSAHESHPHPDVKRIPAPGERRPQALSSRADPGSPQA